MTRIGLALLLVLMGTSLVGWITEGLRFRVQASPKFGLSGQTLTVKVTVPRKAEHRRLALLVDCDTGFFQSWQEAIHGEGGPGVFDWSRQKMAPGICHVLATVYWVDPKAKSGVASRSTSDVACFAGMDVVC